MSNTSFISAVGFACLFFVVGFIFGVVGLAKLDNLVSVRGWIKNRK